MNADIQALLVWNTIRSMANKYSNPTSGCESDIGRSARSFDQQVTCQHTDSLSQLSAGLWNEMGLAGKRTVAGREEAASIETVSLADRVSNIVCSGIFDRVRDQISDAARQVQNTLPPKTEWTVILDLTTDFDRNKDGSFNRLKDLQDFAEKTKGKSLAIVVQAAYRIPPDPPVPYGVAYKSEFRLERHVVRDGRITKVFDGKSEGYGKDLEDLVSYAGRNNNSPKMALIMDTHGYGNEGLSGDTGEVKLDEFINRVQSGLKGSGRQKFDLVDFDACLMAQNGVLARMGAITDQLVASAEVEPAKGISLIPPLELLLDKPETDARTLGRSIIDEARTRTAQYQLKGIEAPIKTIASIELRKYGDFRGALDDFGDKLAVLTADSKAKATLIEIIDSTLRYQGNEENDVSQADLKDFTQRVISAIDDGRLSDPDRSLKRSALDVQLKLGDLVDAFYGHKEFNKTGGVSVFLPTWWHRDPAYIAESKIVSGSILHRTAPEKFAEANTDDKSRQQFLKEIDNQLVRMLPIFLAGGFLTDLAATVHTELNDISAARLRFERSTDDAGRRDAFNEINQAAKRLQSTAMFKELFETRFKTAKREIDESFRLQLVDEGKSGWSRFQNSVRFPKDK